MLRIYSLLSLILFVFMVFFTPKTSFALSSCSSMGVNLQPTKTTYAPNEAIQVTMTIQNGSFLQQLNQSSPSDTYDLALLQYGTPNFTPTRSNEYFTGNIQDLIKREWTITFNFPGGISGTGTYSLELDSFASPGGVRVTTRSVCTGPGLSIVPSEYSKTNCSVNLPGQIEYNKTFTTTLTLNNKNVDYTFFVWTGNLSSSVFQLNSTGGWGPRSAQHQSAMEKPVYSRDIQKYELSQTNPNQYEVNLNLPNLPLNTYTAAVRVTSQGSSWACAVNYFQVVQQVNPTNIPPGPGPGGSGGDAGGKTCSAESYNGVETAIGCVPTEPSVLIQYLIKFAVGIGGGIALLLMVAGAFQMITSSGNPEGIKKGQEQFVSAIIGLLFIIFSVLLLQIIGVKILDIPGFK